MKDKAWVYEARNKAAGSRLPKGQTADELITLPDRRCNHTFIGPSAELATVAIWRCGGVQGKEPGPDRCH
jgi:hypothetical protein